MESIKAKDFVHLHVRTHYSLTAGMIRPEQLVKTVSELGMSAVAITDLGSMSGFLDFQEQALDIGVQPIFGMELNVFSEDRYNSFSLLVLVENLEGYHNLCEIYSNSFIPEYLRFPCVSEKILAKYSKGLILGSGSLAGEIPSLLLEGNIHKAKSVAMKYIEMVGRGNFFLELTDLNFRNQSLVNKGLIKISEELDIPLIATNNVHFLNETDKEAHDILSLIRNEYRLDSDQVYLKSSKEMQELFSNVSSALENTVKIAERCNFVIPTINTINSNEKCKLAILKTPNGQSEFECLKELCGVEIKKRYSDVNPEIKDRLQYELNVINDKGFVSYFLMIAEVINFSHEQNIVVFSSRGTAGSLVCYLLGISEIDPIRFNLLFDKFIDKSGQIAPDIAIEVSHKNREKIIDYIKMKSGPEQVAQMISYNYFKARSIVREVSRVLGVSLYITNKILKTILPSFTLAEALQKSDVLKKKRSEGGVYETLFRNALKLEGLIRNVDLNSTELVMATHNLTKQIPLYKSQDGTEIVAQFNSRYIRQLGLLKLDVFSSQPLTIIKECCQLVYENHNIKIDFDIIGDIDPRTFALLQSGETLGVFQLESPGMQELLKKMKPDTLEDIASIQAIYRPSTLDLGYDKQLVNLKNGQDKPNYIFLELEPILKNSHGLLIYQEQMMQVVHVISGFSLSDAAVLRIDMIANNVQMVQEKKKLFVVGAVSNGFDKDKATELYKVLLQSSSFLFPKSHSVAYAILSYRTAYLKANYYSEFMEALESAYDKELFLLKYGSS